jgi:hypothetical protein
MPKNAEKCQKYICESCGFNSSKFSNWSKHILTAKHQKQAFGNIGNKSSTEKNAKASCEPKFICETCNKAYMVRSGLWRHSLNCCKIKEPQLTGSMMVEIIKQNEEFKSLLLEQHNKIVELSNKVAVVNNNNKTTNNFTNSNNNNFNLNFFLNETCKDAMNIKDFIENIQVQMKELENVGKNGYVNGITNIILDRLKQLDVCKRPLHCTDLKREVLYIRDENEWNKDSQDRSKIKNMITQVASKNYKKIPEWRSENPECKEPENEKYDFCIKLMRNSLGELGEEQVKLDEKIIKNIAKEVTVDK